MKDILFRLFVFFFGLIISYFFWKPFKISEKTKRKKSLEEKTGVIV